MRKLVSRVILPAILSLVPISLLSGCSACSSIEHSEEVTSEVTAAQLEGRRTARKILHLNWKDSTELKECYHKIIQYRDSIAPNHTAEFDSTFMSTIRIVNPTLAFSIRYGRL